MLSVRVPVRPELISWALDQADADVDSPRQGELVENWLEGSSQPTLKQLQDFAKRVHVPFGYLLLSAPRLLRNHCQIFVDERLALNVTRRSSPVKFTRNSVNKAGSAIMRLSRVWTLLLG